MFPAAKKTGVVAAGVRWLTNWLGGWVIIGAQRRTDGGGWVRIGVAEE